MRNHKRILFFTSDEEFDKYLTMYHDDTVWVMDPHEHATDLGYTMRDAYLAWGYRGTQIKYVLGQMDWYYRFAAIFHPSTDSWLINTKNIYIDFFDFIREKIVRNKHIPWRNG